MGNCSIDQVVQAGHEERGSRVGFMMRTLGAHKVALKRAMEYCVSTPERGWWLLKPSGTWNDRDKGHKFKIHGYLDSDYAKDPETRRSVSGYATFLEDAP
jgi:hypothetical protein